MKKFTTYNQFIKSEYEGKNPAILAVYKKEGGFKAYKANYIKCYGFSDWLKSNQGCDLTALNCLSVARSFSIYGGWSNDTMPMILSNISRQYDIGLPATHGILSAEYWNRLNKQN